MKTLKTVALSLILLFTAGLLSPVSGEAVSMKAKDKRYELLTYMLNLEVAMANFGTEDQKETYEDIKKDYSIGLAFFFEENYLTAYETFLTAQSKMEKLYEEVTMDYLTRTEKLLQAAAEEVVELELKYTKGSETVERFLRDREAPKEKVAYDPKDFHKVYDKRAILNNLQKGYEMLGEAKRVRQRAIDYEKFQEEGKDITPRIKKTRLDHYMATIDLARQAKVNAIHVFQLKNRNEIYKVQKKYDDNFFMVEKDLDPVFDTRIPEEFVIDANDALERVHEEEVNIKLKMQTIEGESEDQNNENNEEGAENNTDNG